MIGELTDFKLALTKRKLIKSKFNINVQFGSTQFDRFWHWLLPNPASQELVLSICTHSHPHSTDPTPFFKFESITFTKLASQLQKRN